MGMATVAIPPLTVVSVMNSLALIDDLECFRIYHSHGPGLCCQPTHLELALRISEIVYPYGVASSGGRKLEYLLQILCATPDISAFREHLMVHVEPVCGRNSFPVTVQI